MIQRDTFTRLDSATLGVAEQGGTWVTAAITGVFEGSLGVVGNHAEVTAASAGFVGATLDALATNQTVQAAFTFPAGGVGIQHAAGLVLGYSPDPLTPSVVFAGIIRFGVGDEKLGVLEARIDSLGNVVAAVRAAVAYTIPLVPVTVRADLTDGVMRVWLNGVLTIDEIDIDSGIVGTYVGLAVADGAFVTAGVQIDNFQGVSASAPAMPGPCEPFATLADVQGLCPDVTQAQYDVFAMAASRTMYARTGRQYGLCRVRDLRPCAKRLVCGPADSWGPWVGLWRQWWQPAWGVCGCACSTSCTCAPAEEVDLGVIVHEVHRVIVDGDELASTAWHLDERRYLVRTDGDAWPYSQDMAALSGTGVFSVDMTYGIAPPRNVVLGTASLICELVKAKLGQDCALPENVRSQVRQGVATEYVPLSTIIGSGLTGVYLADLAIAEENPAKIMRSARGLTAGRGRRQRQVGP